MSSFQFQQFTVCQDMCAMKVGTDATLLGAWARGGSRILDIGTGTGILALMMAQRFTESTVVAVDIDPAAAQEAEQNFRASPFATRLTAICGDIRTSSTFPSGQDGGQWETFSAIVCNPPYFVDALTCPDQQRTTARHAETLTYSQLMLAVSSLLTDDGELSLIIPADHKSRLEAEAALAGLFKTRQCAVRTTPRKQPKRYLLAYAKHPAETLEQTEEVLEEQPGVRSPWYTALTKDFYIK